MAVKKSKYRIAKFQAKIDHDVIRERFLKLKSLMVEEESEIFRSEEEVENRVKEILESEGVATYQIPFYLCFAREVLSKVKKLSQQTLILEEKAIRTKWTLRGLNNEILKKISRTFGIEPIE